LGFHFTKHRHGKGPEHLSSTIGETVFEIYPASGANQSTASTQLGFSVPSLTNALGQLRRLDATVLTEPADTQFGLRAVVKDFEGHKVELYEKGVKLGRPSTLAGRRKDVHRLKKKGLGVRAIARELEMQGSSARKGLSMNDRPAARKD
jgi:lactoylglutathione lyase